MKSTLLFISLLSYQPNELPAHTYSLFPENIIQSQDSTQDIIDSLGLQFPYIELDPAFILLNKKPLLNKSDMLFIPVDNTFEVIEGNSWSAFITNSKEADNNWSLLKYVQMIEKQVFRLGGQKISDGKISRTEIDRVKNDAAYWGNEGTMDYWNNSVKTYLIERANGAKIYIHISGNNVSGAMQIIETAPEKK